MTVLIILTTHFPYQGGEQFIEEEIKFWEFTRFEKIYLLPSKKSNYIRSYPNNVELLQVNSIGKKFFYVWAALFNSLFYKEIKFILRRGIFSLRNLSIALRNAALILREKKNIEFFLESKHHEEIFIYSYWNDVASYAACLLKVEKKIKKVFSRAHRYDLYEEERKNSYMPYKRFFSKSFDRIFLLSETAINYYKSTYDKDASNLSIARLGVRKIDFNEKKSNRDEITLVSISYCVPVKQIDKIMKSILLFNKRNENFKVKWIHIGAGELFDILSCEAKKYSNKNGLQIDFLGGKSNHEVHEILNSIGRSIFINGSASEGIPVSIMEAMSYGIPAIAPDIGGIADLVNSSNGYLLKENYDEEELACAIKELCDEKEWLKKSVNAKLWVDKYFNSEKNYKNFIKKIEDEID